MIAATVVVLVARDTGATANGAAERHARPDARSDCALSRPTLAQILMSATDPKKVTELDTWLKANQKLKGTQPQDAAVKAGFEPSFVALTLFPQVVAKMAEQIAGRRLGQSFTSDRSAVFDSIQRLRLQAKKVGTLKSSPQQEVETKTTSAGQEVIVTSRPIHRSHTTHNTTRKLYTGAQHHGHCPRGQ